MRFAACLCLALSVRAAPDPAIPTTPAGTVFAAWLDAFNSNDRARVASYLAEYEPNDKAAVNRIMNFRDQTGGFTLLRVEKSEPLHLEALVKEREGDNFARLTLDVSSAEPPIVKGLRLQVVPRPSAARLSFNEAVKDLDAQAAELASKDKFSGDLLVARSGKIVLQKSYGLADREKHIANTLDTRFRIGSMNKMFTATAILQLAGNGTLDLAAPLGKYLPDYPNKDVAAKVTIRHLLTHTGGTGDIFTPEYDKHRLETRELTDYVKLYGSRGLQFEPGSKWAYSNYGFVLLGIVVQNVSGMSYYDYVRTHIFIPAGMHDTGSLPESEAVPNRSVGYLRKNDAWVNNVDTLPWRGTSAGGGYSTVGDLFRFAEALSSGKLLKPELFAQMTSKQAGDARMPTGEGYGFGMMVSEEPQGKRFGHGGGAPGMNGELRVYPRTNSVVVVLANLDPPAASRLADFFDERMPLD
ncbi:MAG: beta-lactamase family protein [Acidobacteriota bacterium]|nr:beta-lactamase family protein [Acidobacteriota bacterium]